MGIATLEEARELMPSDDLFSGEAEELLGRARAPLAKLAKLAEATAAEVKQARDLYEKVKKSVVDANDLYTVLAASRVDDDLEQQVGQGNIATHVTSERRSLDVDRWVTKAEKALRGLRPLHFPVAFPQVFLRKDRPGVRRHTRQSTLAGSNDRGAGLLGATRSGVAGPQPPGAGGPQVGAAPHARRSASAARGGTGGS